MGSSLGVLAVLKLVFLGCMPQFAAIITGLRKPLPTTERISCLFTSHLLGTSLKRF